MYEPEKSLQTSVNIKMNATNVDTRSGRLSTETYVEHKIHKSMYPVQLKN
jgi:hypothetical protein